MENPQFKLFYLIIKVVLPFFDLVVENLIIFCCSAANCHHSARLTVHFTADSAS